MRASVFVAFILPTVVVTLRLAASDACKEEERDARGNCPANAGGPPKPVTSKSSVTTVAAKRPALQLGEACRYTDLPASVSLPTELDKEYREHNDGVAKGTMMFADASTVLSTAKADTRRLLGEMQMEATADRRTAYQTALLAVIDAHKAIAIARAELEKRSTRRSVFIRYVIGVHNVRSPPKDNCAFLKDCFFAEIPKGLTYDHPLIADRVKEVATKVANAKLAVEKKDREIAAAMQELAKTPKPKPTQADYNQASSWYELVIERVIKLRDERSALGDALTAAEKLRSDTLRVAIDGGPMCKSQ